MAGGYVPPHARRRGKNASSSTPSKCVPPTLEALEQELRSAAKRTARHETIEDGLALYARALENLRIMVGTASEDARGDDARLTLANALLEYASEITRAERMKALSSTTRSDEARATERAISCAQGALQAFESLRGSPLEKSNGVATALSRIVELGGAGRSATEVLALLVQAVELYDSVATSIENDSGERDHVMPALWNCADARLKVAEHQAENGDVDSASTSYQELLLLYERACGFCDSTRGDDFCGLLYDWGCSLTSYASFISQSLNASEDAVRVVDAAIEKLRAASQFTVGDVGPLNALGDAYQAKADILQRRPDATNAVRENLCLAITEAYDVALKTNGGDLNAMLGHAEVNMTLAAMFRKGGADVDAVRAYKTAWKAYEKALTLSEKHQPGSCEERFEVLYNSACAANRAGEQDAAQNLISLLLLCDGTTRDAIAADPDLAGL